MPPAMTTAGGRRPSGPDRIRAVVCFTGLSLAERVTNRSYSLQLRHRLSATAPPSVTTDYSEFDGHLTVMIKFEDVDECLWAYLPGHGPPTNMLQGPDRLTLQGENE